MFHFQILRSIAIQMFIVVPFSPFKSLERSFRNLSNKLYQIITEAFAACETSFVSYCSLSFEKSFSQLPRKVFQPLRDTFLVFKKSFR